MKRTIRTARFGDFILDEWEFNESLYGVLDRIPDITLSAPDSFTMFSLVMNLIEDEANKGNIKEVPLAIKSTIKVNPPL